MAILGRNIMGVKRPCRVGDCGYGSEDIMIRVLVKISNWGSSIDKMDRTTREASVGVDG